MTKAYIFIFGSLPASVHSLPRTTGMLESGFASVPFNSSE